MLRRTNQGPTLEQECLESKLSTALEDADEGETSSPGRLQRSGGVLRVVRLVLCPYGRCGRRMHLLDVCGMQQSDVRPGTVGGDTERCEPFEHLIVLMILFIV